MAKLKAPLLSLGASGAIAKALVFFPWKGLNVVREYVIPANPKTALQQQQRAWLTAAVADIHAAQAHATNPMLPADITAYALWASVVKAATTWFNQAVKNWVDVARVPKTPTVYRGGSTSPGAGNFGIYLYSDEAGAPGHITAGKFFYGTSKTALINSQVATIAWATESISATIAGLTAGTKYYAQFRPDVGENCEGANSGIYHETPN